MSQIRVRYAPSPTGFLHVGGARTLLFNWLYAKRHGGKLILRVEDTDQARSTRAHEEMILKDIAELNLAADESPLLGGPHAPYRQSERLKIYGDHARQLLDKDQAYFCFCPASMIEQKREVAMKLGKPPHYDGTCAKISRADAEKRIKAGEKAGVRFRAFQKSMILKDLVRGEIDFKDGMVGDFLITRTPTANESEISEGIGMPVYNFCCVIDDHLMEMTHIIRGEDHLSNTARQLMIYEAFGWKLPEFAHTAMVLGNDRQKLSKRNGDTSVHDYLDNGYLMEALLNFLVLIGWWPKGDYKPKSGHPEIISIEELTQIFDVGGFQKAPGVFDVTKLKWMNSQYIKQLPVAEIAKRSRPFFEKSGFDFTSKGEAWLELVIDAIRAEVQLLSELPERAKTFLEAMPTLEDDARKALAEPTARQVVDTLESELSKETRSDLTAEDVDLIQKMVAQVTGLKGKQLFMPIRAALTGKSHGPELKKILPLIGRESSIKRVKEMRKQAGV